MPGIFPNSRYALYLKWRGKNGETLGMEISAFHDKERANDYAAKHNEANTDPNRWWEVVDRSGPSLSSIFDNVPTRD